MFPGAHSIRGHKRPPGVEEWELRLVPGSQTRSTCAVGGVRASHSRQTRGVESLTPLSVDGPRSKQKTKCIKHNARRDN